ncbi:MAG: hypothetical protein GY804_02890 [Alphaproteobacteria bacterium]|nr:hypothetical protein [Alphaproteobacteria bacterium]
MMWLKLTDKDAEIVTQVLDLIQRDCVDGVVCDGELTSRNELCRIRDNIKEQMMFLRFNRH